MKSLKRKQRTKYKRKHNKLRIKNIKKYAAANATR